MIGVPEARGADRDRGRYDVGRRMGWIIKRVGVKWRER